MMQKMSVAVALLMLPAAASAFCGHYVGNAGAELYNRTSQVAIARQAQRTTLTLANDVEGNVSEFALVIPVPEVLQPDDVQVLEPEIFSRLDGYSSPRLVRYSCDDFYYEDFDFQTDAEAPASEGTNADGVTIESQFAVGEYEIVVLSATQSTGLLNWLNDNDYAVSAEAQALLDEYISSGSFFFAAKVNLEENPQSARGLNPLQFSYDSAVFSLPIRIGTLSSPGEQDLIVYALTDSAQGEIGIANYPQVELETGCMTDLSQWESFGAFYADLFATGMAENAPEPSWVVEYSWAPAWCDPCSGDPLSDEDVAALGFEGAATNAHFTRLHTRYTPEGATQDLVLYTSQIQRTYQQRYIEYDPELEDRFPICGVGFVENPGTCPDDPYDYDPDPSSHDDDRESKACASLPAPVGVLWLGVAALAVRRRRQS